MQVFLHTLLAVFCLYALTAHDEAFAQQPAPAGPFRDLTVAGWAENAWIGTPPVRVKAKLDTGAGTSSIHAGNVEVYMKAGRPHVRFTLQEGQTGKIDIERPVARTVRIRRAGTEKTSRPVIVLRICLAGHTSEAEFTLADRSGLNYPVLIGRAFLAGRVLVDPERAFIATGLCANPGAWRAAE